VVKKKTAAVAAAAAVLVAGVLAAAARAQRERHSVALARHPLAAPRKSPPRRSAADARREWTPNG
jgi:hypothetical protein